MYEFNKSIALAACLSIMSSSVSCTDDQEAANQEQSLPATQAASATIYDPLQPIAGWDRYSGDSARSLKGWCRWWKYLILKEPVVINWIEGLKLRIHPKNEVFRSIFVRGIYDPNLIVAVNSCLRKGSVFIDVGASMGYFSLLASKVVGSEGRVVAVEPSSRDFTRLVDNGNINNLQNMSVHRLAVTDTDDQTVKLMVANEERSSLNTLGSTFSFKGLEKETVEEVRTVTIDTLVQKENLEHVDFIKLDIEGSELVALKGAMKTIETYRPVIMLGANEDALSACGFNIAELETLLQELRYKAYVISESPKFELVECPDLKKPFVKVVFCIHESIIPPTLPQPAEKTCCSVVTDFFTK